MHYIQNSFFKNYNVIKNRIFNYSLSNRTLIGSLLPEQKSYEQRLTHKMMAARLRLVAEAQVIQSNTEEVFHMQTWQENRRKVNFYFPKYSVSLSQSSVETIGKLKAIEKITLYVISQGWLTPWLVKRTELLTLWLVSEISSDMFFWCLTHLTLVLLSIPPENIKKPKGFLMISGGIEKQHRAVTSWSIWAHFYTTYRNRTLT